MSSSRLSSQTPLSPKHVQNFSSGHQDEHSFESAFINITSSLQSLDFNAFFHKFDLDSPVCRYMEAFSPLDFHALLTKASAATKGLPYDSPAVKAIKKAKKVLDDELGHLNAMFEDIEAAGLHIGTVRHSLRWLREVNRRSLDRLRSSQQDHGLVSENQKSPLQFRFPIPSSLLAWQKQQQHYRDAYVALMAPFRPPQADRSIHNYPSPPAHTGSHDGYPSPSAHSVSVQSPIRTRFSSHGSFIEQEELEVPFIPPPPTPLLFQAPKGKNPKSLSVFIAKP